MKKNRAHEFLNYLLETAASDEYEQTVLDALKAAGIQGNIKAVAGSSATEPDSDFFVPVGNKGPHIMEIKMDWGAQLGGGSWTITEKEGKIKYKWTGKIKAIDMETDEELRSSTAAMKSALTKWLGTNGALAAWRRHVQKVRTGMKITVIKDGKKYQLRETASGQRINQEGKGLSCSKFAWEHAKRAGLLQKLQINVNSSVKFMEKHYESKGARYIQLGGPNGGFYRFGDDSTAANFKQYVPDVPEFGRGPTFAPIPFKIEMRATRAGAQGEKCALSIRAQGRQKIKKESFEKSPYRMDEVASIRKLMTTYNNNFLSAQETATPTSSTSRTRTGKRKSSRAVNEALNEELSLGLAGGGSGRRTDFDLTGLSNIDEPTMSFRNLYDMPENIAPVKPEDFFELVESKNNFEYDFGGFKSTTESLTDYDYDFDIGDEEEDNLISTQEEDQRSWNMSNGVIGMSNERFDELVNDGYEFQEITDDENKTEEPRELVATVKESKVSLKSILF
jgi:hypothetical protein